jgi:hypothetical protein
VSRLIGGGGTFVAFEFRDLDEVTRKLMVEEANLDETNGVLFSSDRLTQHGKAR